MATERARSIRIELFASLAAVLVMAIVSLVFAAELLGERRHAAMERTRWATHAESIASIVHELRDASGRVATERARRVIQQDLGTSSGLTSIELFELAAGPPALLVSAGLPDGSLSPPSSTPSAVTDRGRVVVSRPVPGVGPGYVIRMLADATPWSRGTTWAEILGISGAVAIVLLVLGTILVEVQVVRPLRALREATDRVALGDLRARVPEAGSRELVDLANGFNRMIEALSTQRHTLQSQSDALRRSEHMAAVGRLSSGVAHEVGNPLAALVGYTELVLDDPTLGDESRQLLERIRGLTQRIQDIVSQLLDYSRHAPRRLGRIAVRPVIEEVVALCRAHPGAADVEVVVDAAERLEAWADPGQLSQVLSNLMLNGARAARSAPAPRVVVHARPIAGGRVAIDVSDNGPGVAAEVRARIFEPFFTTQPSGTGTGLGLAISRGLAQGMDATLELLEPGDVDPPDGGGPGACFRIALLDDEPARPDGPDPNAR